MAEQGKIKELFETVVKPERPKARYWMNPYWKYEVIDFPRGMKMHGSSLAFKCNEKCWVNGDIVVYPGIVDMISKEVEKLNCRVVDVHEHKVVVPESHIHIECSDVDMERIKRLISLVRYL